MVMQNSDLQQGQWRVAGGGAVVIRYFVHGHSDIQMHLIFLWICTKQNKINNALLFCTSSNSGSLCTDTYSSLMLLLFASYHYCIFSTLFNFMFGLASLVHVPGIYRSHMMDLRIVRRTFPDGRSHAHR